MLNKSAASVLDVQRPRQSGHEEVDLGLADGGPGDPGGGDGAGPGRSRARGQGSVREVCGRGRGELGSAALQAQRAAVADGPPGGADQDVHRTEVTQQGGAHPAATHTQDAVKADVTTVTLYEDI